MFYRTFFSWSVFALLCLLFSSPLTGTLASVGEVPEELKEYEAQLKLYERRLSELEAARRSLEQDSEKHRLSMQTFKDEFESHNRAVDQLASEMDSHNSEIEQQGFQNQYYQNDLESYESDAQRYNSALQDYETRLEKYEQDRVQYEGDAAAYDQANDAYGNETNAYNSEADQYNALPQDQRPQFWHDRLERWLAELNRRYSQLVNIKSELDQRFYRLSNEKSWLDAKYRELNSEKERLDSQLEDLNSRYSQLQTRSTELDARAQSLNTRKDQLNANAASLDQQAENLSASGENLSEREKGLIQLEAELDQMYEDLQSRYSELDQAREELSVGEKRLDSPPSSVVNTLDSKPTEKEERDPVGHVDQKTTSTDIGASEEKRDQPRESRYPLFHDFWRLSEEEAVRGYFRQIPHENLRAWMESTLQFKRVGQGLGPITVGEVRPPTLYVYDSFFDLNPSDQKSYLGFEAGKAFFLWRIAGHKDAEDIGYEKRYNDWISQLSDYERYLFNEMQRGGGTPNLYQVKEGDSESLFGFVFRAVVFDLPPSPGYNREDWEKLKDRFVREYMDPLFSKRKVFHEPPSP